MNKIILFPERKKYSRDDKVIKIIKIAFKIALHSAKKDFSFKDENGNPIGFNQFALLINTALSPQKALPGEDEFVRILYESKVEPEWIANERIKNKLLNFKPTKRKRHINGKWEVP